MPRGYAVYHFATKADYDIILREFEAKHSVKYVLDDWLEAPNFKVYPSIYDFPEFGRASRGDWLNSAQFLVLPMDEPIRYKFHEKRITKDKYELNSQLSNPKSIFFRPSSYYKGSDGEALLMGEISTISKEPDSQAILKTFKKLIRKYFEHFGMEYAGPEAVRMMDAGVRLCQRLQAPRGADLTRNFSTK